MTTADTTTTGETPVAPPRSLGRSSRSLAVTVLIVAALWPLHAFTLATLWGWFAVTALGVPPLTVGQAAGLLVLARFLAPGRARPEQESTRRWALGLVLWPLVALGIGAVIRLVTGGVL